MKPRLLLLCTLAATSGAADPRIDYMVHCEGCHLAEGAGWPGLIPALRGDFGRIAGVPGGRDYLMRVPGVANAPLSSESLANVLNWLMRTLNTDTAPPDFQPFSAEEVDTARRRPLLDPGVRRSQIYQPFTPPSAAVASD